MTCDNCTLQVIQDMSGNTTTPVMDPAPDPTYYACADIRLVEPGSLDDDDEQSGGSAGNGGSSSGGSANAGEAGGPSAGGTGGAAGAAGSGGAATGGTSMAAEAGTGAALEDADEGEDEESGCAFRASESSSTAGWALALLGLAAAVRRRAR
jgi:MYXO-CTERM domain-containing protein